MTDLPKYVSHEKDRHMAKRRRYVVVDGNNNISWSARAEAGEAFDTYAKAKKRATDIAESEPGTEVLICEAQTIICCDVKSAQARPAK